MLVFIGEILDKTSIAYAIQEAICVNSMLTRVSGPKFNPLDTKFSDFKKLILESVFFSSTHNGFLSDIFENNSHLHINENGSISVLKRGVGDP